MATYRDNNRDLVKRRVLISKRKNIETRKYFCAICDLACRDGYALKNHLDTKKHKKIEKFKNQTLKT